jgi:NTP pyrophosphatase (non-canonical NTP hydrolase)
MTFDDYDVAAEKTAQYPTLSPGLPIYPALGLCGESGEFAEKIKKAIRDGTFDRESALKELGDVLWYLSACARDLGSSLDEVAQGNLQKLASRAVRGKIAGSGDER